MLKYFNQLIHQVGFILRKFWDFNHQTGNHWQRQTQTVGGVFGANRDSAPRYGTRHEHPAQVKKYSVEEVKRCLRGLEQGERAAFVMREAAQFSSILHEGMRRHFRGRERIFDRLPYVLYQYTHGQPAQEIARSVSYFSDASDIEEAMNFVSRLIAARINRAR